MADVENPLSFGQDADIVHVFVEDGGFHIGRGYGPTARLLSSRHHQLGWHIEIRRLLGPCLGYLIILTEFAVEITPRRGNGK